jgi:hypothetical protein
MSSSLLGSGRRLSVTMVLAFLPWFAVVLFTAGGWAAVNFFAYAIIVFAAGYSIVGLALPAPARAQNIVLAPAVGILAVSALTAFWVRLALPLVWVSILWLVLTAAGLLYLWSDRGILAKENVAYGGALVLLSVLICVIYLLPGARNDAVRRADGSFNWMYVDTQYNYSIAAAIKNGSPPREPGTYAVELLYHFGGYAPAAAISRFDGLDLGDAYARVTRGASLWALMLSCFGVGTLLSLKATGKKFGGIMSVAGLFFYGSLLAVFTDERNSSSYISGAVLFKIPEVGVGHDGGPFSHLILGHSELHALTAITAIMGLCLVQRELGSVSWRALVLLALPALAVAMHSVAAIYCLGVAAILLFWGHLGQLRTWLQIMLMLGLFFGAYKVMGYGHAPDAARATFGMKLGVQWGTVAVAFMIGLGLRILGFQWISKPLRDPVSALVLATFLGLLLFFLIVHFTGGEEIYGVYFVQSVFSVFAFSRLTPGFWHGLERSEWVEDWLGLAKKGTLLVATCWVLVGLAVLATHGHSEIPFFRIKIVLSFLLFAVLAGTLAFMKRVPRFAGLASAIVMGVLMIGFLAWIPPVLNFGMGRMKMDVTLTPGEVQGLERLGELAAPGERFATNKHAIDSLASNRDRSYGYAALSERPVLLEGLQYHTPAELPWFKSLMGDNDLIFSTSDPETVREIAKAWGVRWLVARPGTDIGITGPLPAWLVEQQNSGTLKIYRID